MFRTYTGLLRGIAKKPMLVKERVNSLVSAEISETRHYANETMKTFDEKTLDEMFWEMAKKWPDREALVTENRRMTYREVREEALYISEQLRNEGVKKGEIVGVLMEKGWEQIVAVYGILFAGAAYLPLDIHNPQERLEKILNDSNTRVVLVKNRTINTRNGWLEKKKYISVSGEKCSYIVKKEKNKPENLAYVIYTSGSTGKPKGVMITHHSAANTIVDINSRNQVSEKDVALGISNLHFDLSVYDVFGILGAGGKIVLPSPDRAKDPAHWIELLNKEGVTIWNSVPAFVEMLVEYEEYRKLGINQKLRLILMSGDWIPVALPDRVRGILRTVKMEALGGATEASIWSNCYEIPDVIPENWKSIPYGKPLANQKYYILDQNMENCPNWVPGNLYIAEVISFFHAGTGRLIDYKHMVENLLDKDMSDTQLIGFTYGEYQQYMETPVESLVQDRANLYAETLLEFNVDRYTLVGYCVGGFLALETAKILLENGKKVKLIMIDSRLCQHTISNQLLMEYAYGLSMELDMDNTPYSIKPVMLKEALEKILNGENRNIKNSELTKLSDEYAELGEVFTNLLDMTHEERIKALFNSKKQHNFNGEESTISMLNLLYDIYEHTFNAMMRYRPEGIYSGDITYINATEGIVNFYPDTNVATTWEDMVLGEFKIVNIYANHASIVGAEHSKEILPYIE